MAEGDELKASYVDRPDDETKDGLSFAKWRKSSAA